MVAKKSLSEEQYQDFEVRVEAAGWEPEVITQRTDVGNVIPLGFRFMIVG